jgi:hypothetical protein
MPQRDRRGESMGTQSERKGAPVTRYSPFVVAALAAITSSATRKHAAIALARQILDKQ